MDETEWENVAGTYRRHEKEEDEQTEIQVSKLNLMVDVIIGNEILVFLNLHTNISKMIAYILYFQRMLQKSLKMQKGCLHYPCF